LGRSEIIQVIDANDLPRVGGAYALVIDLVEPLVVSLSGRAPHDLDAGRYLYAGSAKGPGGIRARVRHHLRVGKKVHWHVDRLTNAVGVAGIFAFAMGNQCLIASEVLTWAGTTVPVARFGSSDCRRCPAHLFRFSDGFDWTAKAAALARAAGATGVTVWQRPCP
jgi:Uri superfamily endonuclease